MSPTQAHHLLGQLARAESFRAFTVRTADGRAYPVSDPRNVWLPSALPDKVVVAAAGRGIGIIRLASIDRITCEESEAVSAGRK
jgi:hypothetical protein